MSANQARPVTGTSALYAAIDGGVSGVSTTATGNASISVSTVGSSATNANLPPYYALAYIMKT
jgi:hypothetical protein